MTVEIRFINQFGTTEELLTNLDTRDLTELEALDGEARSDLGYALACSEQLDAERRVGLVRQLSSSPARLIRSA